MVKLMVVKWEKCEELLDRKYQNTTWMT